jgi:hypothetical protein
MTTIVSAFISNINSRKDRNISNYFEYGKSLLKSKTNKIIFLDDNMFELIKDEYYDKNNTLLIKTNKSNLYLYNYKNEITNYIETDNPNKDSLEYFITICNKTEWMREAIKLNPFNTNNFIWVDFGIRHVFKCDDVEFIKKIDNLQNRSYNDIRIGSIWDVNIRYNVNLYKNICWWFAGGVFGGSKDKLLIFSDKMKEKCLYIIKYYKTLFWEVNIWYLIYIENKELFNPYSCDHNSSLIDNY